MIRKTTIQILEDAEKFCKIPPKREGFSYVLPNPIAFSNKVWLDAEQVKYIIEDLISKNRKDRSYNEMDRGEREYEYALKEFQECLFGDEKDD